MISPLYLLSPRKGTTSSFVHTFTLEKTTLLSFRSDVERQIVAALGGAGRSLARVVRGIGHALVIANFHPLETDVNCRCVVARE